MGYPPGRAIGTPQIFCAYFFCVTYLKASKRQRKISGKSVRKSAQNLHTKNLHKNVHKYLRKNLRTNLRTKKSAQKWAQKSAHQKSAQKSGLNIWKMEARKMAKKSAPNLCKTPAPKLSRKVQKSGNLRMERGSWRKSALQDLPARGFFLRGSLTWAKSCDYACLGVTGEGHRRYLNHQCSLRVMYNKTCTSRRGKSDPLSLPSCVCNSHRTIGTCRFHLRSAWNFGMACWS